MIELGPASQAPLTPLSFLTRSARVWRDRPAVRFGDITRTYAQLHERVERIAGGLTRLGVEPGDRVATLLPNVPEMLELHFAVPRAGAVLVTMNTRLSASECRYIVEHSGARCLVVSEALANQGREIAGQGVELLVTGRGYEDALAAADPAPALTPDERAPLSINYTSGTTGSPKGVMYVHRGAYLHALGVIAEAGFGPSSAYLWTLPMFHCNGWAFTWAVTAAGARHVCLETLDPSTVWRLLEEEGITHLCGAPTVITMLVESPAAHELTQPVRAFVGGSPPSP
ncbi:MAG TPA: AMP-binding protein, partial [Solirubrobacteraceae bacterium]|nr:AMP-binding protein [Solirubrobacteraceae bacterium]